nr:uncharacterized protein LOC108068835 isoform X1 [Drosophila takahashii]
MEENTELPLNGNCLLEIMNYVIANCKAKHKSDQQDTTDYDDLLNFVCAHEFFVKLLEDHHKRLYEDLQLALACRITKLLIDLRVNEQSNEEIMFFWRSYLQSINKISPFNGELSFYYDYVTILIKGNSPGPEKKEKLKLNINISSEALHDIFLSNENLTALAFEGVKVLGNLSDAIPHCGNLEELRIKLTAGDVPDQFASLAKKPNLKQVFITGLYEYGLETIFFNDLRKWDRPNSLRPLTLTIEDCLTDINRPVTFATFHSLRNLRIYEPYEYDPFVNIDWSSLIKAEYDISEMSEDSNSIQQSQVSITLGNHVRIKFDRSKEELEVKIRAESDLSQMGNLSKLPNLSRLIIQNKRDWSDYPGSLAKFLQSMAPKGTFALKSCKINYQTIDKQECTELAKIKSLQYLGCHISEWNLIKTLGQLPNLQHVMIHVRQDLDSDTSPMILNLLTTCQIQASIIQREIITTIRKIENNLQIVFVDDFENIDDISPYLAHPNGIKSLQVLGSASTASLNPFFNAFTGNFSSIQELDLSKMFAFGERVRFGDISKVTEIQSIRTLKCCLSDITGIEKLADKNNLKELQIQYSGKGKFSEFFKKLAEKNIIQYIHIQKLDSEEVTHISRIRSLKKLECHFTDPEDLPSLSELANSNIEELKFRVPKSSNFIQKVLASFALNCQTRLQHLDVCNLDMTENSEITQIKGLKSLVFQNNTFNILELKSMPTLQKLKVGDKIGLADCKYIAELEHLESLHCSLLNEPGIQVLASIKNLKKLNISYSKGSLAELFRAFAHQKDSKLLELHTPIICSDEINEISQIKSLETLSLDYKITCNNLSDLGQLKELKTLCISEHKVHEKSSLYRFNDIIDKCRIDSNCVLQIFRTCQKLDGVTLDFAFKGGVATNFVSEVNSILKCVRNPALQRPLKLNLIQQSEFPKFHVEATDDAYLDISYSYETNDQTYEANFFSEGPESDDSTMFEPPQF